MRPYFIFKNLNSKDYFIHVEKMPPVQTVDEEVELIEVPGRDGYLTLPLGRKPYIEKNIVITIYPTTRLEEIKTWLQGSGNLQLSNDLGVYYEARLGTIREYYGITKDTTLILNFICQPNPIPVGGG